MTIEASTPDEYVEKVPDDRREAFSKLRQTILDNLPEGFEECMNYGMIGYVVPHATYPDGYHCDPKLPLPFLNIANQKGYIAFYHMGMYVNEELHDWFVAEYPNHAKRKLDMGKSCIRFKKMDDIPFDLLGQVVSKMTVSDWVGLYEAKVKR